MEHYKFAGNIEDNYVFGFEPSLFSLKESLRLQKAEDKISFYVLNEKHKRIEAQIHFFQEGNVARSPLRNPFGSIEYSEEIPPQVLYNFILHFEGVLKQRGVTEMVIKNYPEIYAGARASLLTTFFINCGYLVSDAEITTVIDTTSDFTSRLSTWEQRKLKQANEKDFTLEILDRSQTETVYSFIARCRNEKNFHLSMTFEQLQTVINAFNDRFILFGLFHDKSIIAASISIKVKSHILYNFYMDHDAKFDNVSPAVKLIEGIHSYCFKNGFKLLDLGTSAINKQPNFGLLNFKLNLGSTPSSKFTFTKALI